MGEKSVGKRRKKEDARSWYIFGQLESEFRIMVNIITIHMHCSIGVQSFLYVISLKWKRRAATAVEDARSSDTLVDLHLESFLPNLLRIH